MYTKKENYWRTAAKEGHHLYVENEGKRDKLNYYKVK